MQAAQPSHRHSKSAGVAPSSRTHLHIHSESHTQVINTTTGTTTTITTADIHDPHMASYEMSSSTTPSTGKTEHMVSAEALTERLLKFKLEHCADTYLPLPQQQSNHHQHYPSDPFNRPSSPSSSIAYPDAVAMGSRRSPQDTLQEILERIERRQHQKMQDHDLELEMALETETLRRQRRLQLNPEMLKDHHHTLRQNHGNANLRHSWQES
ncbi:hypothetical protein EC968_000108 [Mortierella alpina]|nr:hypothetical protein EC968_000108 [Mortierella alpina]